MTKVKAKVTTKKRNTSEELAKIAVKGIQEKKGHNIKCLNLEKIDNAVCGYFIICHGDSTTQVEAIARSVDEQVRKSTGEKPWHTEGHEHANWILLDYVDVVVHIFLKDVRNFYNLEDLWADAKITEYAEEY